MSKILIVAPLLATLSAGAVMGQDIRAGRDFDWTGFYLGVQGGSQAGDGQITEFVTGVPTGYAPPVDIDGLIGGAHIGYNYQTGVVVLGVEADAELADVSGTLQKPISTIFSTRQDWQASLRMRLGVAATDRLLVYATGGLAVTGLDHAFNHVPTAFYGDWNGTVAGVTIGLGAEYALTDHVSLRGEYRYSDFGNFDFDLVNIFGIAGFDAHYEDTLKTHSVRVGLSYRF